MTIFDLLPKANHDRLRQMVRQSKKGLHDTGTWTHLKADGTAIAVAFRSHHVRFNGRDCKLTQKIIRKAGKYAEQLKEMIKPTHFQNLNLPCLV